MRRRCPSGRRHPPGRDPAERPGARRRRSRGRRCGGLDRSGRRDPDAFEAARGVEHPIGQPALRRRLLAQGPAAGQLGARRTEAGDGGDRLHAGPPGPLLVAADEEGPQPQPPSHQQGARAGWSTELVAAHRDEVGAEVVERDRVVPGRGAGVDVDEHTPIAARRHHLGHRLAGPDLVVGPLHVDERRSGRSTASTASTSNRPRPSTGTTVRSPRRSALASRPRSARPRSRPGAPRHRPPPSRRCSPPRWPLDVKTTDRPPAAQQGRDLLAGLSTRGSRAPSAGVEPPGRRPLAPRTAHRLEGQGAAATSTRSRYARVTSARQTARSAVSSPIGTTCSVTASASP